jgi:hypothetical protein
VKSYQGRLKRVDHIGENTFDWAPDLFFGLGGDIFVEYFDLRATGLQTGDEGSDPQKQAMVKPPVAGKGKQDPR